MTWSTVPPNQLTAPAPENSAGVAERVHEVAFDTEAEIVDWPWAVVTVVGEAASPVIPGSGVLAQAGPPDASQIAPRNTSSPVLTTRAILHPKVMRSV